MKNLIGLIAFSVISLNASAEELGKTTYKIACQNCHAPQLASGLKAPAAFDKDAWDTRILHAEMEAKNNPKRYKTAMNYLLSSVKNGKGLMQHGGLCNEASAPQKNCSDEALIAAIQYMSKSEN